MPKAFWSAFLLVRERLTFAKSPNLNSDKACDVRIRSMESSKNGAICMFHTDQEERGIAKRHKLLPTYSEPCTSKGASLLAENDSLRLGGRIAQTYLKGSFVQWPKIHPFWAQNQVLFEFHVPR
jgi:hypothetical protein